MFVLPMVTRNYKWFSSLFSLIIGEYHKKSVIMSKVHNYTQTTQKTSGYLRKIAFKILFEYKTHEITRLKLASRLIYI